MMLNEISLSDNSLGQLKFVTTNVQIMTLFGLKRIVKSCLVQNYSYYCAIPNCYVCQLMSTESLFNKCDVLIMYYNVNFRINVLYVFSICYIYFNEIVSRSSLSSANLLHRFLHSHVFIFTLYHSL